MIDNMVLFDGYIPSSSSTSRPKIVSSAYWDVFIWDFYEGTFLQYYQYCGLLTAVVPPFEDPYVVGVNDKDRIITFNPFATNASKSAFLVKGHEPKNKVKYDSIVISIDHYVREDKVVVVTGKTPAVPTYLPSYLLACLYVYLSVDVISEMLFVTVDM